MTQTTKHTATFQDALDAREARMGTEIEDAAKIGHVQTANGGTVTCSCGDMSNCSPRAVKVVMGLHAREALGTLSIPTLAG